MSTCEIGQVIAQQLRDARIVEKLPSIFGSDGIRAFPPGLVGATVVAIGTIEDRHLVEGGGLVIDYRAKGSGTVTRVVFAFNELAMWVCEVFSAPEE